jgi:hypothetical protein
MIDEMKKPALANDLLKNTSTYVRFHVEPQEILKDQRSESGMAGREVGFERALADWLIKHRSHWRKSRQPEPQLDTRATS